MLTGSSLATSAGQQDLNKLPGPYGPRPAHKCRHTWRWQRHLWAGRGTQCLRPQPGHLSASLGTGKTGNNRTGLQSGFLFPRLGCGSAGEPVVAFNVTELQPPRVHPPDQYGRSSLLLSRAGQAVNLARPRRDAPGRTRTFNHTIKSLVLRMGKKRGRCGGATPRSHQRTNERSRRQ